MFPYDNRLVKAVLDVMLRIPEEDRESLMYDHHILIVQICANSILRNFDVSIPVTDNTSIKPLVLLESDLMDLQPAQYTYFIAHELAHVILEHPN